MALIAFIVVGLIAGFLARAIVPGRDPMGVLGTLVLGLGGALLGGFLARALFNDNDGVGIIGATLGAIILLVIYNAVTHNRRRQTV